MRVTPTSTPPLAYSSGVGDDLEVAEHVAIGPTPFRRSHASQQRPNPSGQLLDLERLGHVVVGPGLEAGDDVMGIRTGRDHDDREVTASCLIWRQSSKPSIPGSIRSTSARSGRCLSKTLEG